MIKVNHDDFERLMKISLKIENIPKDNKNPIITDMKWLTEKLRKAYTMIENECQ